MRRETMRRIVLAMLSLLIAILAAEFLTRWLVTVRDVGPVFTIHDPTLGRRLKPSFAAERVTPEFTMRISTNSLGFRGPELLRGTDQRPILFLGDSFTLGYGVSDGEEYPARVSAALRQRYGDASPPVLNAGIGNSGNGYWIKFLRNRAPALGPRLVVMQVFANDFEDNLRERLFEVALDGSLLELAVPPPDAMRKLQGFIEAVPGASQSHLVGLVRQVLAPGRGSDALASGRNASATAAGAEDRITFGILQGALATCAANGWRVIGVLVGLPPSREKSLLALFARHGASVIIVPSKSERPELYYKIDGHWHVGGHAFVAERVLEVLLPLAGLGS
jgi:hypothetical protein